MNKPNQNTVVNTICIIVMTGVVATLSTGIALDLAPIWIKAIFISLFTLIWSVGTGAIILGWNAGVEENGE